LNVFSKPDAKIMTGFFWFFLNKKLKTIMYFIEKVYDAQVVFNNIYIIKKKEIYIYIYIYKPHLVP